MIRNCTYARAPLMFARLYQERRERSEGGNRGQSHLCERAAHLRMQQKGRGGFGWARMS